MVFHASLPSSLSNNLFDSLDSSYGIHGHIHRISSCDPCNTAWNKGLFSLHLRNDLAMAYDVYYRLDLQR